MAISKLSSRKANYSPISRVFQSFFLCLLVIIFHEPVPDTWGWVARQVSPYMVSGTSLLCPPLLLKCCGSWPRCKGSCRLWHHASRTSMGQHSMVLLRTLLCSTFLTAQITETTDLYSITTLLLTSWMIVGKSLAFWALISLSFKWSQQPYLPPRVLWSSEEAVFESVSGNSSTSSFCVSVGSQTRGLSYLCAWLSLTVCWTLYF